MSASVVGRWWTWKTRADAMLDTRTAGWAMLVLLAVLYVWAYATHPLHPGQTPPEMKQGWWSWADQTKYVEAAVALESGRIDRESYYYPLGYSALGAPFVRVLPAHPFFVANLALVLVGAVFAWRLARRWFGALASVTLGVGFVASHAALLELTLVIPWNTIAVQAAFFAGMWLVLKPAEGRTVAILAAVAAATYWVRPSDAACFAPLLVVATLRLRTWGARVRWGMLGVVIVAAAVASMAWLNWQVFGDWRTPYERGSFENIGFLGYPFTHKLYGLLVDGETFFGEYGSALLWRYPWLFLAVPGIVWWVRREGWAGAACVATIVLNWSLYVGYNDFTPSAIYRFSLIHYITWAFAPLWLAGAAAVVRGRGERAVQVAFAGAAGLFVLALGLKLKERELPAQVGPGIVRELPATRPLWVRFSGEKLEDAGQLRLDGRALRESRHYQIPYVPAELRVMLSDEAVGRQLTLGNPGPTAATPVVGDFVWNWWPRWRRLTPARE